MKNLLRVMVVLMVTSLGACSTSKTLRSPEGPRGYILQIDNQNWDAKEVRVFCGSAQTKVVRGLTAGQKTEVPVRDCAHGYVFFRVVYLGGEVWTSQLFQVPRGSYVKLEIKTRPAYNTLWIAP